MEAKSPAPPSTPPQSIVQDIQQPGNPVIFKSDPPKTIRLNFSSHTIKTVLAGFVMLFLVGGVGVGVYLVGQQQQVKSRASNNDPIPENLSAIVPKNVVSQTATKSAQASSPATASAVGTLANIVIPELESSAEAEENGTGSAQMSGVYDFNGDNTANSIDLSIMYAGWGTPKNDQQKKADMNSDGIINGIDYSIFLPHFNSTL